MIKDIYYGVVASVRTIVGETNIFSINNGLTSRFCLSPCLFALAIDDLVRHILDEVALCMLFAENVFN